VQVLASISPQLGENLKVKDLENLLVYVHSFSYLVYLFYMSTSL